MINMIVAIDKNLGMGINNTLPWKLKEDMKFFKHKTEGSVIVMGRKTYESIGRLLPNRVNVILTRDTSYKVEGAFIINDFEKLLEFCRCTDNVFIIGGGELYQQMLHHVDNLYITMIMEEFKCDTFFPSNYKDYFTQFKLLHAIREPQKDRGQISYNIWKLSK